MTRKQIHTRLVNGRRIIVNKNLSKSFKFSPGQEVEYLKDNRKYVIKRRGRFIRTYFLVSSDNKQVLEDIPEIMLVTTL